MRYLRIVFAAGLLAFVACSAPTGDPISNNTSGNTPPSDKLAEDPHHGHKHEHSHGHDHGTSSGAGHHGDDHPTEHAHAAHHHTANQEKDSGKNVAKLAIGEKVPDFDVTIDGKPWKLSTLQRNRDMTKDGILVLTFWCSFCHSCRHVEHPLDELAAKYKGNVGVIAIDASAGETTEDIAKFAEKQKLSLPIALNASGSAADIFGVRVTTTTIVIDGQGILRYRGRFVDGEKPVAEDALQAVLAGKTVVTPETPQRG